MPRSDAQKAADRRYAEKVKDQYRQFAVNLKQEEYDRITSMLKATGISKADFLRWAAEKLKEEQTKES